MPLDFLSKGLAGLGKKKPTDDAPAKSSAKKGLGDKSFTEAEQSLVPAENKKAEKPKEKKDTRSVGTKVDDFFGLGARLQTKEWCQRKWTEAKQEIEFQGIDGMLEKYRTPMMAFLKKEWSTENANALLALKAGMPMKEFYHKYVADDAAEQVNVGRANIHRELVAAGKYDEIDRGYIETTLYTNLSDSWSRAIFDPDLLKAVFQRLTNMTPPNKVDGGYKD